MTGTAKTEEEEFRKVYNMRVVTIPTNRPIQRFDDNDAIFGNEEAKYNALVADVKDRHEHGQPVLIGTPSVEKSEIVDQKLTALGIPHEVLNAKNHAREANIIAEAGQKGSVTIATNMAGRGTDIKLGEGVKNIAKDEKEEKERHYNGLAVLATERNESRRIDNQLKGRSGRQGDPGYSKFYVSLQDELFIRFAPQSTKNLYEKLGDEAFESRMMMKAITSAQKRVEGQNFDTRKQLLNYDDVLSRQRKIMYERRDHILFSKTISETIPDYFMLCAKETCNQSFYIKDQEKIMDAKKLQAACEKVLSLEENEINLSSLDGVSYEDAKELLGAKLQRLYKDHGKDWTQEMRDFAEKTVTLDCIDRRWTKHIDQMSKLRDAIWLRSYAQTDPLQAYTNEGFEMFDRMNASIASDVCRTLLHVAFRQQEKPKTPIQHVETEAKPKTPDVKFNPETDVNITPDDDGIDRSNPTAKIN